MTCSPKFTFFVDSPFLLKVTLLASSSLSLLKVGYLNIMDVFRFNGLFGVDVG